MDNLVGFLLGFRAVTVELDVWLATGTAVVIGFEALNGHAFTLACLRASSPLLAVVMIAVSTSE